MISFSQPCGCHARRLNGYQGRQDFNIQDSDGVITVNVKQKVRRTSLDKPSTHHACTYGVHWSVLGFHSAMADGECLVDIK